MNDEVVRLLTEIEPYSPRRAAHRALALFLAGTLPRIAERETLPAHLTASVFVVDRAGGVLLVQHPKFERWLQPGGHCDGETDAAAVARRELAEETGLTPEIRGAPFDVDVHPGTLVGEPHMHIDVRFAAQGEMGGELRSPEGLELRWFQIDDLEDPYIREAAEAARTWAIVDSNHGPPPYQSGALTD
jgi:8-oxo-dGTP pyrophosphatase MutT (NUDIX family)